MTLMKFRPFQLLGKNHPFGSAWDDMNLLLEDFNAGMSPKGDFIPAMDIKEDQKSYTVAAELPGLEEKDIDLTFKDGLLTIKGERKFEEKKEEENFVRIERSFGTFHRSIAMASNIDEKKVKAQFKNGVLTVHLPKKEADASTHRISISS